MYQCKNHLFFLTFTILSIHGERWYSANLLDNETNQLRFNVTYRPVFQQKDNHYEPVTVEFRNRIRSVENSKLAEVKVHATTKEDVQVHNPHDVLEQNPSKTNGPLRRPPVFKYYNNTINNLNLIKRPKLKRKVIRSKCPAVTRRQKKQLSYQKAKAKFLEVFEVVEFDHEVCTSSSGLEGTCLPEQHCTTLRGVAMGSCADGYGSCCVTQFSCDDTSDSSTGWFVNPGFPDPSTERLSCSMTLNKADDVTQIRLDFLNFELLPPKLGTCEDDQFVVTGQNVNSIIPILCGVNTGQHIYIEVGDVDGPIIMSVQTVSADSRLFAIKITQLTSSDDLAAPPGCLQYYQDTRGFMESFNYKDSSAISIARYPSYLNNLNYAMCIARASGTCSITYSNDGGMQIVNYDTDGLPVIPPEQAGVEIFNCPTDWLLMSAVRVCGDRLNDGSVLQDFSLDAPITDISTGPITVWFRSDGSYVGRGFKLQYEQNSC